MAIAVISFSLVIILSALNGFESLLLNLYSNFDPDLKIEILSFKLLGQNHVWISRQNIYMAFIVRK